MVDLNEVVDPKVRIICMGKMIGYMLTWTTYGTWLQGDGRGYVKDGETFGGNERLREANRERQKGATKRLSEWNKEIVRQAIFSEAKKLGQTLQTVVVCSNHVHVVARCIDEPIEVVVARYKKAATQALKKRGYDGKVWTRGYDKRFCFDEEALRERIEYVRRHD